MTKEESSGETENKKDLLDVALEEIDRTCFSILSILLEGRKLRFNELQNSLVKISALTLTNRVLSKHLKHLMNKGLVKRTEEGFQNVTYSLSDTLRALTQLPPEEIKQYLELQTDESLPPHLRATRIEKEDFDEIFSLRDLDEETDCDLHDVLNLNLWELKLSIEHDLLLKDGENDQAFWTFLANPLYRLHEKSAAQKCRNSEKYKQMLFDKIDLLITALRNDRELFRKRRETGKRVRA
jgi:DNA-binding HxlR family transcriptional regulator